MRDPREKLKQEKGVFAIGLQRATGWGLQNKKHEAWMTQYYKNTQNLMTLH